VYLYLRILHSFIANHCILSMYRIGVGMKHVKLLLTTREAAWCIISVVSVCQTITFESLSVGTSYLHIRVKVKVTKAKNVNCYPAICTRSLK